MLKSIFTVSVFMVALLAKEPLEITANEFISNEKKHTAIFKGNAKVTQGKSWIVAKKFVVYLDKKNNTKKYEAIGNVRFEIIKDKDKKGKEKGKEKEINKRKIHTKKKRKGKKNSLSKTGGKQHIKGRCRKLIYLVKRDTYILEGNALINDILNNRQMSADKLILDNKNSIAKATSRKKGPVRLIFQIEDNKLNKSFHKK